ncbi:hypothetical protein DPEC_G00024940 [Dallia pectoralis]|uniref:Uncharacterized protein n=1 Tax=Dallia pectoralis TaxID=75939 RepID=A0ACC2HH34_DALPE|nr:hypothetical protein DPEC_G00024940 [Dallia pectoralis]
MQVVLGLFVILLGVSYGLESHCNVTEADQCYGSLGGTVYLHLVTDDINDYDIKLIKDPSGKSTDLFKVKNKTVINNVTIKDRSVFTKNTLKITNIEWSDAGEYHLKVDYSNGTSLTMKTFQLSVKGLGGVRDVVTWSLVAVVLVFAVIVAVYCFYRRRTSPQTTGANEKQEPEHSDISFLKKKGKAKKVPEEVEYGQVVVLEGSRSNTVTDRPTGQEDTIYAKIHPGQ